MACFFMPSPGGTPQGGFSCPFGAIHLQVPSDSEADEECGRKTCCLYNVAGFLECWPSPPGRSHQRAAEDLSYGPLTPQTTKGVSGLQIHIITNTPLTTLETPCRRFALCILRFALFSLPSLIFAKFCSKPAQRSVLARQFRQPGESPGAPVRLP